MGTVIIIAIIVFVGIGIIYGITSSQKRSDALSNLGINKEDLLRAGKYISGHPDIDKPIDDTEFLISDNQLKIFSRDANTVPAYVANIQFDKIKNIVVEDESTIRRRVTVVRLLAVGIFAFALKKKKVDKLLYLIFEWNDGRFDHETIFEFTGSVSQGDPNTLRNKIIKAIR
jgi:hypothetical protein